MIISIGLKYRVNYDGETVNVAVTDAAHNTSSGVTGFLCKGVEKPEWVRVVYPQDFETEIL